MLPSPCFWGRVVLLLLLPCVDCGAIRITLATNSGTYSGSVHTFTVIYYEAGSDSEDCTSTVVAPARSQTDQLTANCAFVRSRLQKVCLRSDGGSDGWSVYMKVEGVSGGYVDWVNFDGLLDAWVLRPDWCFYPWAQTYAPPTPAPPTDPPATPAPPTPVPPTPSPPTNPPATPAPLTPAPPTPSPPTPIPSTAAPYTPSPSTAVPTLMPSTAMPPTDPPGTPAPLTFPATPLPEIFVVSALPKEADTSVPTPTATPATLTTAPLETVGPTSAAPGVLFLGASDSTVREVAPRSVGGLSVLSVAAGNPVAAVRTALLGNGCSRAMPRILHMTGIEIGGSEYAGALVANLSIAVAAGLLGFLALRLCTALGLASKLGDMQGFLRLPSAPLLVFIFVYQGSTLAAMGLVLSGATAYFEMAGLAAVAVLAAAPFALARRVVRDVPAKAVYARATGRSGMVRALIGPGEWVNTSRDTLFVQRFACITRMYKQDRVWFFAVELAASFAISSVKSAKVETFVGCGHVHTAVGVVFFMLLILEGLVWPHVRQGTAVLDVILLALQGAAMFLSAAGYYHHTEGAVFFDTAGVLLQGAQWVMLARMTAEGLVEVYVLLSGRRTRLQRNVLGERDLLDLEKVCQDSDTDTQYTVVRSWEPTLATAALLGGGRSIRGNSLLGGCASASDMTPRPCLDDVVSTDLNVQTPATLLLTPSGYSLLA